MIGASKMRRFDRSALLLIGFCATSLLTENLRAEEPSPEAPKLGLGFFGGPLGLRYFSTDAVRKELKLSDVQVSAIEELRAKLKADSDSLRKSLNIVEGQLLPDEALRRGNDLSALSAQQHKLIDDKLREILDKSQFERVRQLGLQMENGPLEIKINRSQLAGILRLTDDQRADLTRLMRQFWEERRAEAKLPGGPKESFEEFEAKLEKRIAEVLTEEQRRRLEELKGPKADALVAEIRADVSKRAQTLFERQQAKRAAAGDSKSRKPESTPSDNK
jgi:hypothetical protein